METVKQLKFLLFFPLYIFRQNNPNPSITEKMSDTVVKTITFTVDMIIPFH